MRTTTHPPAGDGGIGELGTILSVWAHPDDETFLSAGVMAAARDAGSRVVCATATLGEHGTDDPETWPPERLARVRRWEISAAMAVLGVDEHRLGGMPDGALADHDDEGVAWVGRLLDEVEPDTVLTFGPDGATYHPDHIAVHRWVVEAWSRRDRRARLLFAAASDEHYRRFGDLYEEWAIYMTDERPTGVPVDDLAVHLHLEGAALDRKVAALRAMATQTAGSIAALGLERFTAPTAEESFVAAPGVRHAAGRRAAGAVSASPAEERPGRA